MNGSITAFFTTGDFSCRAAHSSAFSRSLKTRLPNVSPSLYVTITRQYWCSAFFLSLLLAGMAAILPCCQRVLPFLCDSTCDSWPQGITTVLRRSFMLSLLIVVPALPLPPRFFQLPLKRILGKSTHIFPESN